MVTLMISPLRALMANQQDKFEKNGLKSIVLKKDVTIPNDCDIVLLTPEFIMQGTNSIDQLKELSVIKIVIDECHFVISWGKLIEFRQHFKYF